MPVDNGWIGENLNMSLSPISLINDMSHGSASKVTEINKDIIIKFIYFKNYLKMISIGALNFVK